MVGAASIDNGVTHCTHREKGDVINVDATLREELLEVPVRQPESQIPPDRQHDHFWRGPEAREH